MEEPVQAIIQSKFTEPQIMYLYDTLCELLTDLMFLDVGHLTTGDMLTKRKEINKILTQMERQMTPDQYKNAVQCAKTVDELGAIIAEIESKVNLGQEFPDDFWSDLLELARQRNDALLGLSATAIRPIGRTKSGATIQRETRRILNKHGATIVSMLLEKALSGDTVALVACTNLLLASNNLQKAEVELRAA